MSVVVGYVPTREGETALEHAVREARSRGVRLVVVNTSRGDALVDERYADDDQLAALGPPSRQRRGPRGGARHPRPGRVGGDPRRRPMSAGPTWWSSACAAAPPSASS